MFVYSRENALAWLLANCRHDLVLFNALVNEQHGPEIRWDDNEEHVWDLTAISETGWVHFVRVFPHPETGEPFAYGRLGQLPWASINGTSPVPLDPT